MEERRGLWRRHNSLKPCRPLVLVFPEGAWPELLPESVLQCRGDTARIFESELHTRIYYHEHFDDDTPNHADARPRLMLRLLTGYLRKKGCGSSPVITVQCPPPALIPRLGVGRVARITGVENLLRTPAATVGREDSSNHGGSEKALSLHQY